jgi:YesN/AraC family two-component response regulator
MQLKVLFVDDDPFLLQALERSLKFACPDWTTMFLSSAEAALEALSQESFDILVTDIRMPGMNGVDLIESVRESNSEMLRVVLSGQSDLQQPIDTPEHAHLSLTKPCSSKVLKAKLETLAAEQGGSNERE